MNDLRLLYQIDPDKNNIVLQFQQIASLEPLMPILQKFQQLETLSLHGNRIRYLPNDLSCLQNLIELDISNNLFSNIQDVIESLKTLPKLRQLSINFKNQKQENYLQNSLPNLQRLNKKLITKKNDKLSSSKPKSQFKLSEAQLEEIGILYDQIRDIYRHSKYLVDKQLATDFERDVENIMSETSQKINLGNSKNEISSYQLSGKYGLIDLCFVKMITFFYRFDKKTANVLEKIHDNQAQIFRSMTQLFYRQIQSNRHQNRKIRVHNEALFKAEIKRLKKHQEESVNQQIILQQQNRKLFNKLYEKTKTSIFDNSIMNKIDQTVVKTGTSRYSLKNSSMNKENHKMVKMPSKPKVLSLHQLKEILYEIYHSKIKMNQSCYESFQPLETMETHMYSYLNLKYGLKNLALQWAMAIVNGIRKYGQRDPEICLFGKTLRNQIQQKFIQEVKKIKIITFQSTKKFKHVMQQQLTLDSQISLNQCHEILLYMHIKNTEATIILDIIRSNSSNNILSYEEFERLILEYYIKSHEKKISKVVKIWKDVDSDEDGVIDYPLFEVFIKNVNPNLSPEMVFNLVDTSGTGVITFSRSIEVVLENQRDFQQILKQQQSQSDT